MDFLTKWVNSLYLVQMLCYLGKMVCKRFLSGLKGKDLIASCHSVSGAGRG